MDVTGYFTTTPRTASEAPVVSAPPSEVTTGAFKLAMVGADGSIARWDPCTSIDVYVNFTGAQPGAPEALARALAEATLASGLQFVVRETDSRARTHGLQTLTLLWLDEIEMPSFRDGTVGLGGGAYSSEQILEAWVYVDRDDPLVVPGTGNSMLLDVLLHELGHALGLAHVDDDTQVMFPYVYEHGAYQSGDLDGLWLLGADQGCIEAPPTRSATALGATFAGEDANAPTATPDVVIFEMA